MTNIKEINRRYRTSIRELGVTVTYIEKEIDAEIEVRIDGERRFLTAEWNSTAPEELLFHVTKEPLLDLYAAAETNGEEACPRIGEVLAKKIECDIRQEMPRMYQELVAMINAGLEEVGEEAAKFLVMS